MNWWLVGDPWLSLHHYTAQRRPVLPNPPTPPTLPTPPIPPIPPTLTRSLPLILERMDLDAAHASTTIQVVMDISGVLIVVSQNTTQYDAIRRNTTQYDAIRRNMMPCDAMRCHTNHRTGPPLRTAPRPTALARGTAFIHPPIHPLPPPIVSVCRERVASRRAALPGPPATLGEHRSARGNMRVSRIRAYHRCIY